jgi:FixJ family two-component response regulator
LSTKERKAHKLAQKLKKLGKEDIEIVNTVVDGLIASQIQETKNVSKKDVKENISKK